MRIYQSKIHVISDKLIKSWLRCRRKAWLDSFGDQQEKIWNTHTTLQLDHQRKCFSDFMGKKNGVGIGIEACKKGKDIVAGLTIKEKLSTNEFLKARPPLLKKINGQSIWGPFSYEPLLTLQGKRLTRENKLSFAMSAKLLTSLQKNKVHKGIAISQLNQTTHFQEVRFSKSIETELKESIEKLKADLLLSKPPQVTSNRKKCSICCWKKFCDKTAYAEGHLSEVSGIGSKRNILLKEMGISNISILAGYEASSLKLNLSKFGPQHAEISDQIIRQAKTLLTGKAIKLQSSNLLKILNKAPGLLIYDIESDPDEKHDFLHGFVRISNLKSKLPLKNKFTYKPLLSVNKSEEYLLWERIRKTLKVHEDWPILHYGETESLALYRLAERQRANKHELEEIKNRLVDIHLYVKEFWCLPINNYGLKSVAEFIGFKWESKGIDGPQALLWWRQWKNSRPHKKIYSKNLRRIFQYNKDDCLATWEIAKWLSTQD